MSLEEPVTMMDVAEAWASIVKRTWPEHAAHELRMDDRGTWCVTCDTTLVRASG